MQICFVSWVGGMQRWEPELPEEMKTHQNEAAGMVCMFSED